MKVMFLDIDGVLNSQQYQARVDHEDAGIFDMLDPEKLELFQTLVKQTDANIVLSSSWRESFADMESLDSVARNFLSAFEKYRLSFYDMTPLLSGHRDEEIRQWLSEHTEIDTFVILDDENYGWKELEAHWVKTSYNTGLTDKDVQEAVSILHG